jgi:hypothetical protein
MFHFSAYIGNYWPLAWMHVLNMLITLYPTMQIIMYKLPKSRLQLSYIFEIGFEFNFFMLEADHKLNLYDIAYEFKIYMVEVGHKFNLYDIAYEFKIDMVEVGHKFNLYDIANEFKIVMAATNHKFHSKFLFINNGFKYFKVL